MKVAFFIAYLGGGGAERMIVNLSNEFSKKSKVCIYTVDEGESFFQLSNEVEHRKLGLGFKKRFLKLNFFSSIYRLILRLKKDRPDILISFIDLNNVIAIIAAKVLRIPVIISERSNPELSKKSPFLTYLMRRYYKKANLIILQTNGVKSSFDRLKINLPKVSILPNFLSDFFFQPIDFSLKKNIILSVGRLRPEKNHIFFLKTISTMELNDWKVKVVGNGEMHKKCESFINDNGLLNRCFLEGAKTNVIDYYNEAALFVLPSKFEGFPNVLLEAMSRGCICIASDCDYGPRELINHRQNGFLFKVDNHAEMFEAIKEALCLSSLAKQKLLEASLKTARQFTLDQVSNAWFDTVYKVLDLKN